MTTRAVSVTIEEHLLEYANAEVAAGRARSVSAVINAALARRAEADREADAAVRAAAQAVRSDPAASAKVARMTAHVLAQRERHLAQAADE
ncbi:type II toxin-antitoxin system ParD family antitoxin [Microbispora sp. CSR-4]|uniref:type II toxin-antitoxin system ParD family antitoxin n=1 Tax=Microbispora sp. CSR-4 TaxID=2592813 RepID=UPI0011CB37C9|nr:type II toxin-antitoxin system ParD family antitoxin [Microbispora sp. CSR-4]